MPSPLNPTSQRLVWIDSAKGIGIVLVVIGHAWRGLETAHLIRNPSLYSAVDTVIYSFHMPLFFFLSGLLVERVLLASSPTDFVISRVRRLIWPLALWTWIFFLFKAAAGSWANKASDWTDFPIFPLPPREHFWFLWALFLIQLATLAIKPVLQSSLYRQRDWLLFWLASVLLCLFRPPLGAIAPWFISAILSAPYFLLGAAVSNLSKRQVPVWLGLTAFVAFLGVVASSLHAPSTEAVRLLIGCTATLLLCCTVMSLQGPLFSRRQFAWIGWLGTASMAIYVSHTVFSAATRIVLIKIGVTDLWVHIIAGTLVGLLFPAVLYVVSKRTGISGMLGF